MRRIVLAMSVSLDGFMEGPHREIDWHRVDDELHQHFNDHLGAMSGFLSGRVTHELMAGFWPTADQDPASTPTMAEYSRIWREKPKIVYSRTLDHADWNTTIVREVVVDEVNALKAGSGGDLALGGADLAATFVRLGLVDEYVIYVHPVILGAGKPLLPALDKSIDLTRIETRAFGNGVTMLRYAA